MRDGLEIGFARLSESFWGVKRRLLTLRELGTSAGRIGAVVLVPGPVYTFKCKLGRSAEVAVARIEATRYAALFEMARRGTLKLGVSDSLEARASGSAAYGRMGKRPCGWVLRWWAIGEEPLAPSHLQHAAGANAPVLPCVLAVGLAEV